MLKIKDAAKLCAEENSQFTIEKNDIGELVVRNSIGDTLVEYNGSRVNIALRRFKLFPFITKEVILLEDRKKETTIIKNKSSIKTSELNDKKISDLNMLEFIKYAFLSNAYDYMTLRSMHCSNDSETVYPDNIELAKTKKFKAN